MTERLYLDNSYITQCEAEAVEIVEENGQFSVLLNKTIFYPTGGGQPHDLGTLNGVSVIDAIERGGEIYHITDESVMLNTPLTLKIDWARRFDFMQQHTGEHLLSFAVKELYGFKNVGFHMAVDYCTVDFEAPLSDEQLREIELFTNNLIYKNLPVNIDYLTQEQLDTMEIRKKADGIEGSIRLISMPGGDSCTCCGTHVKATGEVGPVKIVAYENYKGGSRLNIACGLRAQMNAIENQDTLLALSRKFSCRADGIMAATQKLSQALQEEKRQSAKLYSLLEAYLVNDLISNAPKAGKISVVVSLVELSRDNARKLGANLCKGNKAVALLLTREGDALDYALCRSEDIPLDISELASAVNSALLTKGGGRGTLAQGRGEAKNYSIEARTQIETYIVRLAGSVKIK